MQAVQIAALKQAARVDFAETPATLGGDAALDSAKNLAMLLASALRAMRKDGLY